MINITAIVLRAFMFNDSKMMVDVISREEGRLSCVVSVGSAKARKGCRQFFQPLTILDLVLDNTSANKLPVVKDVAIHRAYASIPFNPSKVALSMFLSEFVSNITRTGQDTGLLYDYVYNSLMWLDGVSMGFSNFHLVFMIRITRFLGVYPNLDEYADGSFFDMDNGCFVRYAANRREFLSAEESRMMYLLMRMNYNNMHLFRFSHVERNRCLDVILDYYKRHVPGFADMKSLPVLREMFRV